MAPRTTGSSDDNEFDLARLLWGDLPLIAAQPDAARDEQSSDRVASGGDEAGPTGLNEVTPAPPPAQQLPPWEREVATREAAFSLQERPLAWDVTGHGGHAAAGSTPPRADVAGEAVDLEEATNELDLDALAALASFADPDVDDDDDDPATSALTGELIPSHLDERLLSYGELTERLEREVLPRLRGLANRNGYLTLGYFARAVIDLQGSDTHLDEVRAFATRANVPVLPSRSHKSGRALPLWAIQQARQRFEDLLRDQIDERVVVERFGYEGVPLSQGTRSFLVQAWMSHCLSRAEERAHVMTIATEIARVGERFTDWSGEALAARDALILDNLWLVARIARSRVGRGVEVDDLIQSGALGLFRAVLRFDPARNFRFVTYASGWVFQSITRHIADNSRLIRLPVHVHDRGTAITETEARLWQSLEREPTLREIADASAASEQVVRSLLVSARPLSLDDPRQAPRTIGLVADRDNPVEMAEASDLADAVQAALESLSDRERGVLELRFGLLDGEERTLEEVGRVFSVTRERIRQIEATALHKLRHPSRAKRLEAHTSERPKSVLGVSAAAAEALLPEFSVEDQDIIRWIWGLNGRQQQTVQSTAKRLRASAERVREVCVRAAALHCDRGAAGDARAMAGYERMPAANSTRADQATREQEVDPGWNLDAADTDSVDWADRRFAEQIPLSPPPVSQLASRPDQEADADEPAARAIKSLLGRLDQRDATECRRSARSRTDQIEPVRYTLADARWQAIANVAQDILDRPREKSKRAGPHVAP